MKGVVVTYYTLDDAREIIAEEHHHSWLCRQKEIQRIRQEQKRRREYYCRQKMLGIIMAVISLVLLALTREAFCLVGIIIGTYVIATKQMVLINEYWWSQKGDRESC